MTDHEPIGAIWDYLDACAQKHRQQRTAERFGVSRQTLWRFLDRDQVGRRLLRAVLGTVGDSVEALAAVTDSLIAESSSHNRLQSPGALSGDLRYARLGLCEAPLTTAGELAQLTRVPAFTVREQLVKLAGRGLAEWRPHWPALHGSRPLRRYVPTHAGIRALADSVNRQDLWATSSQDRQGL